MTDELTLTKDQEIRALLCQGDELRKITLIQRAAGWEIREVTRESVYPSTLKGTDSEMAARVLQLLGLGVTEPQKYPERICVGRI